MSKGFRKDQQRQANTATGNFGAMRPLDLGARTEFNEFELGQ